MQASRPRPPIATDRLALTDGGHIRFSFWTGLSIAIADEMPRWTPGDEFEAPRLEALEAVAD
jgi:hypothetical protein